MPLDDHANINSTAFGRVVLEYAEVTPADIDVARTREGFTKLIPIALEDYGFRASGEGDPLITVGNLNWPNGGLPATTSDLPLSEAYPRGLNLMIECARQMRGTSTFPVEHAHTCLVISGAGHKRAAVPGCRP